MKSQRKTVRVPRNCKAYPLDKCRFQSSRAEWYTTSCFWEMSRFSIHWERASMSLLRRMCSSMRISWMSSSWFVNAIFLSVWQNSWPMHWVEQSKDTCKPSSTLGRPTFRPDLAALIWTQAIIRWPVQKIRRCFLSLDLKVEIYI